MPNSRRTLDGWAISLSGLCLAHCLLLPAAAAALPLLGAWTRSELVHLLFALVAAPLSGLALLGGERKPVLLLALAGSGVMLLAAGVFTPWPWAHTPVTVLGSLLLVAAHIWNWRRLRPARAVG